MTISSRPPEAVELGPVLACRLDVLTELQRARRRGLLERLAASVVGVDETATGFRLRYAEDPDVHRAAAEWVTLERQCCPFLSFRLTWNRAEGPALELGGGDAAKDFLRAALGA
jgi:hypothetical protein